MFFGTLSTSHRCPPFYGCWQIEEEGKRRSGLEMRIEKRSGKEKRANAKKGDLPEGEEGA